MERKRKGISYTRKSIKPIGAVDDKESILYQTQACERYCEAENLELVESYSDIGYSGTTKQRPELLEMLNYLETTDEKIDVLLFYSVDRLGRDLANNI